MTNDFQHVSDLLIHQPKNYWIDIDEKSIRDAVPVALGKMRESFSD